MDPLVEGVHDPSLGEFPCARASVAAGDALGRAEEQEPLLEDVAQGSGWGWLKETPWCPNGGGSCSTCRLEATIAQTRASGRLLFASPRDSGFGPGSPGSLWARLELLG